MVDQYIALAIYAGLGFAVFIVGFVWNKFRRDHHDRFSGRPQNEPRPQNSYHVVAR